MNNTKDKILLGLIGVCFIYLAATLNWSDFTFIERLIIVLVSLIPEFILLAIFFDKHGIL